MKTVKTIIMASVLTAVTTMGFVNCSDIKLAPLPAQPVTVASIGEFCVSEPQDIVRLTKFMFVIDKSGSNVSGNASIGDPTPTDPGATKRGNALENFYNQNQQNQYLRWGLVTFQDPGTKAVITDGVDPIFTNDEAQIRSGIGFVRTGADAGGTPYGAALALAQRAIQKDIQLYPQEDNTYYVFFISDGVPTDITTEAAVRTAVRSVVNAKPGKVILSTGYYTGNQTVQQAAAMLSAMAEEGGGVYKDFQANPNLDINDLIVAGPSREPWIIKKTNVVAYNLSSAICEDGAFDTDSDSDGLCDRDEAAYNGRRNAAGTVFYFDPLKRYSNSGVYSNYSDYFAWRTFKFGESLPICNLTNGKLDIDFDGLNECEERAVTNANPSNPWNYRLTTADVKNPDSDGDTFIDLLETFAVRTSRGAYALDMFNVLAPMDSEQMSAGEQLKLHKNPLVPDPGAPTYDTEVTPTGVNALGQSCYRFKQERLQLHPTRAVSASNVLNGHAHGANENLVLLYYIQTPQSDPNGRGVYKYSYQKLTFDPARLPLDGYGAGLKLNQFSSYTIPEPAQ
jgi:hypothetical protein